MSPCRYNRLVSIQTALGTEIVRSIVACGKGPSVRFEGEFSNLVQPTFLEVGRLEPAWILAPPTSQPRQPEPDMRMHAHTRIRDGKSLAAVSPQNSKTGWTGWEVGQDQCLYGSFSSNLSANLGRLDR